MATKTRLCSTFGDQIMDHRITWKSVVLDALIGCAASCLAVGAMFGFGWDRDPRIFVAGTGILFLLAGIVRRGTGPANPFFKGLLVGAGAWMPAILLDASGFGFTDAWILGLYICVSLAFVELGIWIGRRAPGWNQAFLITVVPVAVAVIIAAAFLPDQICAISRVELNGPAPSFSFYDSDGQTIHSRELRGKVIVLGFWATWCAPCRREMPELVEFYSRYRRNPRVSFWMINVSWSKDSREKATSLMANKELNLPCAFSSYRTDLALRVSSIPKVVVIDQNGSYRLIRTGYSERETLAKDLLETVDGLLR